MKKHSYRWLFWGSVVPVLANEGVWMPQQFQPLQRSQSGRSLKLDPAKLTKLTEFPMGAIVSPRRLLQPLVCLTRWFWTTNHHCVYGSVAYNSKPERNLLANGFTAHTLDEGIAGSTGFAHLCH